jgi:hypothetical protein
MLRDGLSQGSTLLVLDNCEHLIEAAAALAQALLQACPALHLLATSRQRLGVTGELAWRAPSLPAPDPWPMAPHDVLDLLDALEERSLVLAEAAPSGLRYRMLETVREYARERLHSATCPGWRGWGPGRRSEISRRGRLRSRRSSRRNSGEPWTGSACLRGARSPAIAPSPPGAMALSSALCLRVEPSFLLDHRRPFITAPIRA